MRNVEQIKIMLRNEIIPSKERTHFLGMTLDSRLYWEEHINKLKTKAKRALNTIKVVAGRKLGDLKTLKKLQSAIYGCQLYNTASAGRLKKLNSLNREDKRIYFLCFIY